MNNLKTARFITQVAGWILFFSLPLVFMLNQRADDGFTSILHAPSYWIFCGIFLVLFYLLSWVLIPGLYLKRRYAWYFTTVFVLFAGVYVLKPFDRLMSDHQGKRGPAAMPYPPEFSHGPDQLHRPPPPHFDGERRPHSNGNRKNILAFDIVSIFLFIMIVALTMAIEINKQLYLTQKKAIKAEADRAEAELSFLKAQINPHFLYNTLNNIYTLAVTSNPNTAESIMRLSNIMRYITDDIKDEYVSLQDELDCISDFIGLQKLRLGEKSPIEYTVSGKVMNQKIAPLLLMTFVENAFKYGVSKHRKSPIILKIRILEDGLTFYAQNRNFAKQASFSSTGIGIENTKQRLQHLYSGKYKLNIDATVEWFTVDLILGV